jgi:hypothetical protein
LTVVFDAKADLLHVEVGPACERRADMVAKELHEFGQVAKAEHFNRRFVF